MVAGERGNKIGMLKEGNLNRPARQNTNEHSLGGGKNLISMKRSRFILVNAKRR